MPTDIAQFIQATALCDTHEHLNPEDEWLHSGFRCSWVSQRAVA